MILVQGPHLFTFPGQALVVSGCRLQCLVSSHGGGEAGAGCLAACPQGASSLPLAPPAGIPSQLIGQKVRHPLSCLPQRRTGLPCWAHSGHTWVLGSALCCLNALRAP